MIGAMAPRTAFALIGIAALLIVACLIGGGISLWREAGALDRQVKQLWADEETLIRSKQVMCERNPGLCREPAELAPLPTKPLPGQRDA